MTSSTIPQGDLELHGRIMPASNATFLGEIDGVKVVYKPVAGERPLWDFPDGTLAGREVATYAVSEALGWDLVPTTWLGRGPHGHGMLQVWQDVDPAEEAVTLVRAGAVPEGYLAVFDALDDRDREVTLIHEDTAPLRRMSVFDVIVNNADRKGGHVLEMHGVTLHHEPKLRTVLWGWGGQPLSDAEVDAVRRVREAVTGDLGVTLAAHLTELEIVALERRCTRLLQIGCLPVSRGEWPSIPWPPF